MNQPSFNMEADVAAQDAPEASDAVGGERQSEIVDRQSKETPADLRQHVLVVDAQTGMEQHLPADEATEAFKAGIVTLPNDAPIGFTDADGVERVGDAQTANAAVAAGGTLIPHAQAHHAELVRGKGGLTGGAEAFGGGLARGASLGLSDAGIRALGGDEAVEDLDAANEAHPWLKAGGELGGMALGAKFVPGLGVADELGGFAGRGLAELSGGAIAKEGASLGARALAHGIEGAATGGAWGLQGGIQNVLSEEALHSGLDQHPDLTGEQLVDQLGHDVIFGAVLGGLGGVVTEGAGTALREGSKSLAPKLDSLASKEMWRDLNSGIGVTKQAMARVEGGTEALGKTAREIGLDDPRLSVQDQLNKTAAVKGDVGSQIGETYRKSGATGTASEMLKPLDELIEETSKIAGNESTVTSLKQYRASLIEKVTQSAVETGEPVAVHGLEWKPWDPESGEQELIDRIKKLEKQGTHPEQVDALEQERQEQFGERNYEENVSHRPREAADVMDAPVSLAELWKQRVGLNRLVYQEAKALDPKLRVELLRTFSGKFQGYLEEVGTRADPEFAAPLRKLNQQYQHLSLIEDSLELKVARQLTNRRHSLTDSLMSGGGLAGAGSLLLGGHPLLAAAGLAGGFANKFLREKAPQLAAYTLGRVGTLEGLALNSHKFDDAIVRTVGSLASRGETSSGGKVAATSKAMAARRTEKETRDTFEAKAGMVRGLAEHPDTKATIGSHFGALASVAPKSAKAAEQAANMRLDYLAKHLPPEIALDPLRPDKTVPPSIGQQQEWMRRYDATPDLLLEQVGSLKLDPVTIDAIRSTAPASFQKIVTAVHERLAEKPETFDRRSRLALSMVTGTPLTPASAPTEIAARQAAYGKPPSQGGPKGMGSGSASTKPMQQLMTSRATGSESIAKGD